MYQQAIAASLQLVVMTSKTIKLQHDYSITTKLCKFISFIMSVSYSYVKLGQFQSARHEIITYQISENISDILG
jgi:hypothetical protein